MSDIARMTCVACRGGEPTLTASEITDLQPQVPDWGVHEVDGVLRLQRAFKFKDFVEAIAFTNRVAAIAEEQGHHPLIVTEYGRVRVDWWTHKIRGLHRNDFIMAARTDELFSGSPS